MSISKDEGGTVMATASETRRELAHRASNGIEVFLFWSKATNQVTVEVFDARLDEGFRFEVEGARALDAFNHPYAYAPALVREGSIGSRA
jgi:hypothetical protein